MRCHYDVLALERDAAAGDIKKAFHRQALKWHPDKHQRNDISSDEATQRFQEIQNAYEVLSDPHERKWYDDHRDQILRGDDGTGGDGENENDLNLFRYFRCVLYPLDTETEWDGLNEPIFFCLSVPRCTRALVTTARASTRSMERCLKRYSRSSRRCTAHPRVSHSHISVFCALPD
jgi:curved DNA-binding protein CbpA